MRLDVMKSNLLNSTMSVENIPHDFISDGLQRES